MSATVALNSASFWGIDRGLRLHGGQSLRTQASPAFTESATVAGEGCAGPKRNPPCVFRHGRVAVPGHPRWHSHPFLSLPNPTKTRPLRLLHPYKAPSWHESARNAVPACVCGDSESAGSSVHRIGDPVKFNPKRLNVLRLRDSLTPRCTTHQPTVRMPHGERPVGKAAMIQ